MAGSDVKIVNISSIKTDPNQPRKIFNDEAINNLAISIKEHGIIQPIVVEEIYDGLYSIIAGERRFRASKIAGLTQVPVIIKNISKSEKMQVALIENIQRENLNPIEEAYAFHNLTTDANLTQQQIAEKVGKSRSYISNSIRLLNLSDEIKDSISSLKITAGHARALLAVVNLADRDYLFKNIIDKSLTVREAEIYANYLNNGARAIKNFEIKRLDTTNLDKLNINSLKGGLNKLVNTLPSKNDSKKNKKFLTKQLEDELSKCLKTRVKLKGEPSCGKISIDYLSYENLKDIFNLLGSTFFIDRSDEDG